MASEAASLLDQLMGAHRNAVPGDDVKPLSFTDREVCKFYLCGFCPSDLFTNTRADIGETDILHTRARVLLTSPLPCRSLPQHS